LRKIQLHAAKRKLRVLSIPSSMELPHGFGIVTIFQDITIASYANFQYYSSPSHKVKDKYV
jgi:hypothetical protein